MDTKFSNNQCVIVVSSFDGFSDIWEPFSTLFFRYWSDCPYQIYLISNFKTYNHPRVTSLAIGADGKWANNLFAALDRISATHIIYLQDDYFLTQKVDTMRIQNLVHYVMSNNIGCIRLFPQPAPDLPYHALELGMISQQAEYRISLQAAIWNVPALKALMCRGESGGDVEIEGTKRANAAEGIFLSVKEPVIDYIEGATKGKWNIAALRHCRKERVPLQRNARGTNYGMYFRATKDRLRKLFKRLIGFS